MEETKDKSPGKNEVSVSNTSFSDWDISESSNETVNSNYEDWNLSKSKTNGFNDSVTDDNYDARETLTNNNAFNATNGVVVNSAPINDSWGNPTCDYVNSKPRHDSWGNQISSVDQPNEEFESYGYSNGHSNGILQDSWSNPTNTNNCQNYDNKNCDYGRRKGQSNSNFNGRRSNNFKSVSEKPSIPKPTYIPPEFEDDDNLCIEAGSNFGKYDKIEVTVSGMEVPKNILSFQDSGLRKILINNLLSCHYTTPTPIQKYALPIIMNGRDMIASAQTGSGKTAAFLLPILNNLLCNPSEVIVDYNHCEPQALIMSPTRELAIQICEVATRLSKSTHIKSGLLYGGTATYHQKEKILRGVHIIVATPGRLLDFVKRGLITFSSLRFFVLDEADRMLDMGFQNDVEQILNDSSMVSSDERSTVMFSATLPDDVQQIAKSYLQSNYISVAVGEIGGACKDVIQICLEVTKFNKKKKLIDLLNATDDYQGTIVFVEQKRNADFIAAFLSELNYPTTSIHGDRDQADREKALRDFKTKRMKILVATAVAARGLDIMGVTMVVNFDLPNTIEEYVHRIGRTGRLGNSGRAVSFFDPENDRSLAPYLVNTLKKADQDIPEFLTQFSGENFEDSNQFNDIRTDVTVTSEYINKPYEEEEW